jgi:hypothetical protein
MKRILLLTLFNSILFNCFAQSVGINLTSGTLPNTSLDVNGAASFREGTALTLVNGTNNDVALGAYSLFRITGPTVAFSITGFAGGTDGRILTIINATSQTMSLMHQVTSLGTNQINTGGTTIVLTANGVATLIYNATMSDWVVTGTIGASVTTAWSLTGNGGTTAGTNFVGTTDAQDLVFKAANTEGMRLQNTTNYVGIGTTSPAAPLHVIDAGGTFGMRLERYGSTGGPRFSTFYARGTSAAPTAVQSGDNLARWITFGYNGTSFPTANPTNGIFINATENYTTTANGGRIAFQTIANGTTSGTTRMIIDHDGEVGIGLSGSPDGSLHLMDNGNWGLRVDRYNSIVTNGGPRLSMFYGRGTETSPNAVQSGDTIGRIMVMAHNGTAFNSLSPTGFWFTATENHTTTAGGTKIDFQTIPNGSTAGVRRMTIDQSGNVGIGITTPTQKLEVSGGHILLSNSGTASELRLAEPSASGTNYTAFKAQAQAANLTYTLPAADGTSGQALTTNGAGTMSWTTPSSVNLYNANGSLTGGRTVTMAGNGLTFSSNVGDFVLNSTPTTTGIRLASYTTARADIVLTSGTSQGSFYVDNNSTVQVTSTGNNLAFNVGTAGYNMQFATGGRNNDMVLTSAGNFGIGTSTAAQKLSVVGTAGLSTGTAWTNTSDRRVKENIEDYKYGLKTILAINPVYYTYTAKSGLGHGEKNIGVIAQDLEEILPDAIMTAPITLKDSTVIQDGKHLYRADAIWFAMINAFKEQQTQIEVTKAENEKLKAENEKLKTGFERLKAELTQQGKITEGVMSRLEKLEAALTNKSIPPK